MAIKLIRRGGEKRFALFAALALAVFAVFAGWIYAQPAQAQIPANTVSIDFTPAGNDHDLVGTVDSTPIAPTAPIVQNDVFTIDIVIQNAMGITGFNFGLQYDNTVLTPDLATFNAGALDPSFFLSGGPNTGGGVTNTVFQTAPPPQVSIPNPGGAPTVSVVTITAFTNPTVVVNDTQGLLARISFTATGTGSSSITPVQQPVTGDFLDNGTTSVAANPVGGSLSVGAASSPPIANPDPSTNSNLTTYATNQTASTTFNVLENDTDSSFTLLTLAAVNTVTIVGGTGPTNGSVTFNSITKLVTFDPMGGIAVVADGPYTFNYTVTTADGVSNQATVIILVDSVVPDLTAPTLGSGGNITVVANSAGSVSGTTEEFGGRGFTGRSIDDFLAFTGGTTSDAAPSSGISAAGVVANSSPIVGPPFSIADSPIAVSFTVADNAGNVSAPLILTITILAAAGNADNDGFNNGLEALIGTDPLEPCRITATGDSFEADRHPGDIDGDGFIGLRDITILTDAIGGSTMVVLTRLDLFGDGGTLPNSDDVAALAGVVNVDCSTL